MRLKGLVLLWLAMLWIIVQGIGPAAAQLATSVILPDGARMDVTGANMARGDHALILYNRKFGQTTRTNAFGVEVVATPAKSNQYEVRAVTSVWECQKNNTPDACGNIAIPEKGIVLSATGDKRDALKNLTPGQLITLEETWLQEKTVPVNVINPTPANNPGGSGFPGYRASNQIIVYDAGYGQPTTGTNEFGFEVTVKNGIVVAQEGSDSAIPAENGFVLSGHGKGRSWLLANTPIGTKVSLSEDGKSLTARIDFDTYLYQLEQQWAESPCQQPTGNATCKEIAKLRQTAVTLANQGQAEQAITTLGQARQLLTQAIWKAYPGFPAGAVQGAWHRPVETSREEIGKTLDTLKASGLNAVFLETFFHGYTIFPSQTYAAYGLPAQNPKFKNVDLLKLWTEEAHKRCMKVHVWFQTFYAGNKAIEAPGPILSKYPEWANIQYVAHLEGKKEPTPSNLELGGYFLDPANPEVKLFLSKLIDEIITRYPVDGFQLDYIRYPASFPSDRFSYHKTTWGYTPVAREMFKAQYLIDPVDIDPKKPEDAQLWQLWADFKTKQVTDFVQHTTAHIRQKKPSVKISAAIFPDREGALAQKHQDWANWANRGWLDFLAPMTLTSATKVVGRDTDYLKTVTNHTLPVYSGVFGPFNDNTADQVLQQIEAARSSGASGFVLFDTAHLTGSMLEALQTVHKKNQPACQTGAR